MRADKHFKFFAISVASIALILSLVGCSSDSTSETAANTQCSSENNFREYVEVVDNCGSEGKDYQTAMVGYVMNNICDNLLVLSQSSNLVYRYLNFPNQFKDQALTNNQLYIPDKWFDDAIQFASFSESKSLDWLKSVKVEAQGINEALNTVDKKALDSHVKNLQKLVAQLDSGELPEISNKC